jgi:branched-chain amino acid transport system substrate-binding protein
MRNLSKLAVGALFACALAAPALAEDGVTDTEIVLGTHTDLSSIAAIWGVQATAGARMRFEEENAKGGIHGRKVRLIVEDHGYQVPRAVQAANKLINNDKVFLIHGALGTPMNNAVLGDQLAKGVANIFPFTAARSMAEPHHPLKFATYATYYDQVRANTKYFVEQQGKKQVCSMYQDTDFGHEVRDAVRDQAKALKVAIATEAAYGPLDSDFTGQIGRIKDAGCDLVVIGSIIKDTIQAVGTAKKLGLGNVTFVGQSASYDPIVAAAPGGITEGFYSGTGQPFSYIDTASNEIKDWAARYKAMSGKDANSAAQYSYMGADIIIKALNAAGKDLTRAKFIAALEAIKDYKGLFPGAVLSFGPNRHQGSTTTFLLKVEGGRWKPVAENLMY